MILKPKQVLFILALLLSNLSFAENGYDLWLRYKPLSDSQKIEAYKKYSQEVFIDGSSPTMLAIKSEIRNALTNMLSCDIHTSDKYNNPGLVIGTWSANNKIGEVINDSELESLKPEGYLIKEIKHGDLVQIVITAKTEVGLLYGTFAYLRHLQCEDDLSGISISNSPKTTLRLLNHWDNLDRTVERGYAGFSIWDWHKLPDFISKRYIDYARANASIGINGTVITNVNSNALVLTKEYLIKLKALADVFRPYGIKVYLTARFNAPMELSHLPTADPLDADVQEWWKKKAAEIYELIPDFGGFLVKANSEGQPGPQDYGRSHADGANLLAKALQPYNGVVMWRAFVYSQHAPDDRAKQAYNEFMPLDGKFEPNVLVQVKNGPIDFQPREPFHPLFGAMEKTPLMMEFQITQEYLGCATHLVYLAPLYKETLESDTYAKGKGSTVAKAIDGTLYDQSLSGMAGVSNIGTDINWTGHPFAQSNWYAFGRLAWDPTLSSEEIAREWLKATFTTSPQFVDVVLPMMLQSRETTVDYMTPLGLHHQMAWDHHWGPGPWVNMGGRADWTSYYYHRADVDGLGFDRTTSGSDAVSQYFKPVAKSFDNLETCPEEYLLWFHHVPWDYKMKSGQTLWNELCDKYYSGTNQVAKMQQQWNSIEGLIDHERFDKVQQLLKIQMKEAVWWRNAMLLYFQQFSKQPIPAKYEQPDKTLEYYMNLQFHFVPGI